VTGAASARKLRRRAAGVLAGALCVLGAACDSRSPEASRSEPVAHVQPTPTASNTSKLEPYPFTRPAPPSTPTVIDGVYSRSVSIRNGGGKAISCRRCAPYRLDPGNATLIFDRGRFYVALVPQTTKKRCTECKGIPAFEATGHYEIFGNRLLLYNDASCTRGVGMYRWAISEQRLFLQSVKDRCFTGLRSRFLSSSPWTQEA
jgi:hypothetical protein